jgi:STE24 endopeptidase
MNNRPPSEQEPYIPDYTLEQPVGFVDGVSLDQGRQAAARDLARQHRRLMVVETLLSFALVIGFLLTGLSVWLKDLLQHARIMSPAALVAAYTALVYAGYTLVTSPLSWYGGFVLPHRYGLSTQDRASWIEDEMKSLFLGLVLGVPVAEVIYWLLRAFPGTWWVWAAAFLILFAVLLGHLAPVLIMPLFYKFRPLDDPQLVDRIRALAEKANTRIVGVYTINLSKRTTAGNAMVVGLGAAKRIALGDTLYADYSPQEIETIIAHELGHQVHHDLELGIIVQSLLFLGGMYLANLFLNWGVSHFGFQGPGDVAAMPLLVLAIGLFSFVTMPLINGYSRWRETLADRFAVRTTRNPLAFARAMIRLANQNLSEADPPRWVVWLLYSHPPVKERVKVLG